MQFVLGLLLAYGLLHVSPAQVHHQQQQQQQQPNQDRGKEIIVLNSTNFNAELIQCQHPFPHIKAIEYYLPYCGICRKFKHTFVQLSREVYSWRNVLRLAQLDLAVSYNTPIAQSWSIQVVPTLRVHPTLDRCLAKELNKHLIARSRGMKDIEFQKLMHQEYTSAKLMIQTLSVLKYTNESKLEDKVSTLKQDLMLYVQQFVKEHPKEIPATWPNLKPVTEKTLAELYQNHPRKELFLIIDSSPNNGQPDLGFQIIMELSSSAARKAVRYVRVSDNKEFLEDVISFKKKENTEQLPALQEQIDLLEAFANGTHNQANDFILIHIDDLDLKSNHSGRPSRQTSSYTQDISIDNINLARKLELAVLFINQTYVPTHEDENFLSALSRLDESPTSYSSKREAIQKINETQRYTLTSAASSLHRPLHEFLFVAIIELWFSARNIFWPTHSIHINGSRGFSGLGLVMFTIVRAISYLKTS